MNTPDPAKLEVLTVWYSVFCQLLDNYNLELYTDPEFIEKMKLLRESLRAEVPRVEAEIARLKM